MTTSTSHAHDCISMDMDFFMGIGDECADMIEIIASDEIETESYGNGFSDGALATHDFPSPSSVSASPFVVDDLLDDLAHTSSAIASTVQSMHACSRHHQQRRRQRQQRNSTRSTEATSLPGAAAAASALESVATAATTASNYVAPALDIAGEATETPHPKSPSKLRPSVRSRSKQMPRLTVQSMPKTVSRARPTAQTQRTSTKNRDGSGQRRKKDDDALDCIYVELQDSANMCRYWGKKCWNLRVAKPKDGFHSLCHFHRARANDNQRRFDFKRRGTMWREFQPDPDAADISLFPAFPGESPDVFANIDAEQQSRPETVAKFEPFAQPVALQEQDVELLLVLEEFV